MRTIDKLPEHLKESLDLQHFEVIHIISLGDLHPVVIMRDKRADAIAPWCNQYRGSGHYFKTYKEATDYCINRNWVKTSLNQKEILC